MGAAGTRTVGDEGLSSHETRRWAICSVDAWVAVMEW